MELEDSRVSGHFLVQSSMMDALSWTWRFGDQTKVEATIASNRDSIVYFRARLAAATDSDEIEAIQGIIAIATDAIDTAHARQRQWHKSYIFLCETLIPALVIEELTRERPR
jgi:hypothetical protein